MSNLNLTNQLFKLWSYANTLCVTKMSFVVHWPLINLDITFCDMYLMLPNVLCATFLSSRFLSHGHLLPSLHFVLYMTFVWSSGTCSVQMKERAWWQVDLQVHYTVYAVQIMREPRTYDTPITLWSIFPSKVAIEKKYNFN